MSASLRAATEADIDTLFDIRTSVIQNHLSMQQLSDLGITAATLAEAVRSGTSAWIAELGGTAAGFAMVDAEAGEVFALFVRPEFEGRGLGRLLLNEAEKELFRHHDRICLVTDGHAHIRANGFYLHLGWSFACRVDERDVRYEKALPRH